ncbi:glycoside hydrolase family 43 protein [Sphingobacterium faecale]|uniref:Family 43 glycosylhydrolase n=1 Tax=Sphingobacterium faecale TaxID=2803775 RepID=A0ABS1R3X7_9SPHI|nr:glycoside hydrolase family 43 protein [Sphingobacterium faecale]MBL1409403.1 family 43 glycosylhydrolase [Sphingobacterium faecale]
MREFKLLKAFLIPLALLIFGNSHNFAQNKPLNEIIDIKDLYVRDPFIVADPATKNYYLYKAGRVKGKDGTEVNGVVAYKSKDLRKWKGPYHVFAIPADNWVKGVVWAPEVHQYKGKYYLFATLNSEIEWKKKADNWPAYTFRGTQIFYADSPLGPFLAFDEKMPHTPMDRMALDGTLWEENGIPYMIYCHEWVQIEDGAMELVQLAPDLSKTIGASQTLFNASVAPWSTGTHRVNGPSSYVTDGCFLYTTTTGKLLMMWSSFKDGSYAIGLAESTTGKVSGPWIQQKDLLFSENGGHGMLFKTFEGQLMLTFHGPNSPGGSERMLIFEIEDVGNTLTLKTQLFK